MMRLLFRLVGVPAPRLHRWPQRTTFAAGVAIGAVLAWVALG